MKLLDIALSTFEKAFKDMDGLSEVQQEALNKRAKEADVEHQKKMDNYDNF